MKHRSLGCALVVTALLGATQPAVAAPARVVDCAWQATALSLPGGQRGAATTTDDQGGIAGSTSVPGTAKHVVTWVDGDYTDYGTTEVPFGSTPADQNGSGTIVGTAGFVLPGTGHVRQHAFQSNDGKLAKLPIPEGYENSRAIAINEAGDITGTISEPGEAIRVAVRWPAAEPGTVTILPGMPPANAIGPEAVDEDGAILLVTPDNDGSLAIWRDGVVTALGGLPGLKYLSGSAMSNGRVVGFGDYNGKKVSVYWDRDGKARVLPNSSFNLSNAHPQVQINSAGLIVGRIDEEHGGVDNDGTGYGVWDRGEWVSTFGDITADFPATIGDDGTVAGYRMNDDREPEPYSWHCG